MIDEQIIEFYRSQLAAANEEKRMLYAQVKALTEEVSMLVSLWINPNRLSMTSWLK